MTAPAHAMAPGALDTDLVPPLNAFQAMAESSRCLFCYEPACVSACPTGIDIPGFIRKIRDGNPLGAARTILAANIMGGTCARVCPTEVLCEHVCVRNTSESRPVAIGRLQRHATDLLIAKNVHPFERAPASGRKVAVVGAGPAGLSAAHRLAMLGHEVEIFEARPKPGGLNEYGLAAYKMTGGFARREVDFILGIGGIRIQYDRALGTDLSLQDLAASHDAVFVAIGLALSRRLGIAGEDLGGVEDALSFIAAIRQGVAPPVSGRVFVVGGGNTAVDAAIQARCLGASEVAMVYRRGFAQMGATVYEQQLAQISGVVVRPWLTPVEIKGVGGRMTSVVLARTELEGDRLTITEDREEIPADLLLAAVGQTLRPADLRGLALLDGKIAVDDDYRTGLPGVFAGGDCVKSGQDLTVQAVEDGKRAALAIDRYLHSK